MELFCALVVIVICVVLLATHHEHRTTNLVIHFGGIMEFVDSITLSVDGTNDAVGLPVESDGVTVTPNAVVSDQVWDSQANNIITLVTNPDGSCTVTAVGEGNAQLSLTATVTDKDGTVQTFTTVGVVKVTVPTGRTAGLVINFIQSAPSVSAVTLKKNVSGGYPVK
jgi:hypothetical protein